MKPCTVRAARRRPATSPQARRRRSAATLLVALCLAGGHIAAQEIIPAEPAPAATAFQKYWPFGQRGAASAPPPAASSAPVAQPSGEARAPVAGQAAPWPPAGARPPPDGTSWSSLTPAQRAALEPLAREWGTLDAARRQKWLDIAERLPRLSPEKQARMQERMAEWARMTPQQRAKVRLQFQEARQVAPVSRQESWEAYLALPPEQRRELAERARKPPPPARRSQASGVAARDRDAQAKSNIVVAPDAGVAPRPVAPTVVQAQPGATTTLMSRRPAPPGHQQAGLPKIAATPEFVDRATLLPQRGAQGAAVLPVAASEPVPGR